MTGGRNDTVILDGNVYTVGGRVRLVDNQEFDKIGMPVQNGEYATVLRIYPATNTIQVRFENMLNSRSWEEHKLSICRFIPMTKGLDALAAGRRILQLEDNHECP